MKNDAWSIRECYSAGYDRGWGIASWCDLPEIGNKIDRSIDWVGLGDTVTIDNQLDVWELLCGESESHSRCYSPWEHEAFAINSRDIEYGEGESMEGWNAYDNGIAAGIAANRRKRFPLNNRRKWQFTD